MKRFIFSCNMAVTGLLLIGCGPSGGDEGSFTCDWVKVKTAEPRIEKPNESDRVPPDVLPLEGSGTCDSLKGETAEPAVIRVENRTSAPVYLPTYCHSGPYVFIQDDSNTISASVLKCYRDGTIEIGSCEAYEQSWSGHLLAHELIDVPAGCRADCQAIETEVQCRPRVAAAPGEYTAMVFYEQSLAGETREFSATFTWPTTKVTVAITTP